MHPEVDTYLTKIQQWQEEIELLRSILLKSRLREDFKWKQPCYTFKDKNIAILGNFKHFAALSFFKGALLNDPDHLLKKQGQHTQSARILSFTSIKEIQEAQSVIQDFIEKAIEVEKAGQKVDAKKVDEFDIPEELQQKLEKDVHFQKAFEALTPGRKKAYFIYFSAAKQSKTRVSRIEKYSGRILDGKGMHDCVCGLSSKLPACDGSHSKIK